MGGTLRAGYPLTETCATASATRCGRTTSTMSTTTHQCSSRMRKATVSTSLVGQTFTYDLRDTRFLPSEGYLSAPRTGRRGPGRRQPLRTPRALGRLTTAFAPDWVVNLAGAAGFIFGYLGEDVASVQPLLPRRGHAAWLPVRRRRPARRDTDDALGGNLLYTAPPSCASRSACPRSSDLRPRLRRMRYAYDSMSSGPDHRGQRLDPRLDRRLGLSWLSPLGPLSVDYAPVHQGGRRSDRDVSRIVRHALLAAWIDG